MYSKNLIARIRIINECLTDRCRRYWSIDGLMERITRRDIKISRRTVEHDLKLMRYDESLAYYAPIDYCHRNRGHYYTDPSYTIERTVTIAPGDLHQIALMLHSLREEWSARVSDSAESLNCKVENAIDNSALMIDETMDALTGAFNNTLDVLDSTVNKVDESMSQVFHKIQEVVEKLKRHGTE